MPELNRFLLKNLGLPTVAVITPGSLPVPALLGGGIETVVYDYARFNQQQNIVIVSAKEDNLPAYELDQQGIGHIRISNKSWENLEIVWNYEYLVRFSLYIYRACRILKSLKPDIVHIHNMPHWCPIVRKHLGTEVKIILTNHNEKISGEKYAQQRFPKILQAVNKFVYPSRRIAELDLLEKHPEASSKTEIIYNGVDTDLFKRASAAEINKVREKYQIKATKVILFVGRLVKEKAVDKILEALPEILKTEKDTALVIVGSSFFGKGQKTAFVKKLSELAEPVKDSVIFTGFVDTADVPALYSLASVFVSPVNWDDPSPKTIYEAAACEAPIISTKRGGIPEIVQDGTSAILLDSPYETSKLTAAILGLLRKPDIGILLGKNARKRIMENFSVPKISREWANYYKGLLHG
jgi:spore coat protein SA